MLTEKSRMKKSVIMPNTLISRSPIRKASVFLFLLAAVLLLDSLIPAVATSQSCTTCSGYTPTSTWPSWVTYKDKWGYSIQDPRSDQNPTSIDIDHGFTVDTVSCAVANDGTNMFARMQLRATPENLSGGGNKAWDQYMWQVYIADANGYTRAVVGFDGKSNPEVVYVCDSSGTNKVDVYDYAVYPNCARAVPGDSGRYFFEWQVPLCYIEQVSCNAYGYANRITATSPIRLYFATSASISTINKDFSYGSVLVQSTYLDMAPTTLYNISGGHLNPVELTSFTAAMRGDAILLRWKTATEINNHGFELERSCDAKTWSTIDFVPGHGTSNRPNSYTYVDPIIAEFSRHERVYYRLRQIDRDGKTEYLPVVSVAMARTSRIELSQNYPNPVNAVSSGDVKTSISFVLPAPDAISLVVYDALGREVRRLHDHERLDAGSYVSTFDCRGLAAGRYVYRLIHESGAETRSFLLVR